MADLTENELSHLYMWLYGNLPYCGCGWSDEVAELLVVLLDDIANKAPWNTIKEHAHSGNAATQLIFGVLEEGGLISHGTTFTYSWVTKRGDWVRKSFRQIPVEKLTKELEESGFPHDGEECPTTCQLGQLH